MAIQDAFACNCGYTKTGKNGQRKIADHIREHKHPECGPLRITAGTKTAERK